MSETTSQQIENHVRRNLTGGSTCDEAEEALGLTHQTCSARFHDLSKGGRLTDTGRKRDTRSGRPAAVYVIGMVGS